MVRIPTLGCPNTYEMYIGNTRRLAVRSTETEPSGSQAMPQQKLQTGLGEWKFTCRERLYACDISINCDDIKAEPRQAGRVCKAKVTGTKHTNLLFSRQSHSCRAFPAFDHRLCLQEAFTS